MIAFPKRAIVTGAFITALSIPVSGVCAASVTYGGSADAVAARALHGQTRADLATAMRGEAFANASYRFFAEQARREGLDTVGRLFRRTADVELGEHFAEEAALAGLVHSDAANLADAIAGEDHESRVMYPEFARQAASEGDADAAALFSEIAGDEAAHRDAFIIARHVVRTGHGRIPAPPNVTRLRVPAGRPKVSSEQTKENLDTAMHGEALAFAKYTLYARHAAAHGDSQLAHLFRATANVELYEHFAAEAALAGLVRTTRSNLAKAIAGETYEAHTMYPEFARRAAETGDIAAARLFRHNAGDEDAHAHAFRDALENLG